MTQTLQFINIPPQTNQPPKGLIVILHGWGANAEDVAHLLPFVRLPEYQFIFPNAPYPYPYSAIGRAWYDLQTENLYKGLSESRQQLIDWLKSLETSTGVPLSRTILSGFSQGGAMTLDVGVTLPLAGLISMSGYLHPIAMKDETKNDSSLKISTDTDLPPVLIMHGRQDTVVPLQAAVIARQTLESSGFSVEYHEFDMGHEIRPEMLELLRNFIVANT
ncbi:alpha/beta hydrolase [Scytonema sp. UIC 10036]|uniref:alpha/beta hydrolase n=1 Tax=Scytonema sp. UIC 10036 TaxID=2304196 RepID=UPI0012DA864E|nr:alpha/beta hydrolase [Scytonema sp. UIC 10036]MUG98472.1 alpha/beta hydrolase [Scytonema sp. UIC 10036]